MIQSRLTASEIGDLLSNQENECLFSDLADKSNGADGIASTRQAITGTYSEAWITKSGDGTGDVYASSVYRDSSASNWKCNGGSWEYPADWILQYNLSGAYANSSSLKVRGMTTEGWCYLQTNNAGRVFSDNDVQLCVGYVTWYFCSAWYPSTTETMLFLD
jgi:hypothetical protein